MIELNIPASFSNLLRFNQIKLRSSLLKSSMSLNVIVPFKYLPNLALKSLVLTVAFKFLLIQYCIVFFFTYLY